ncbi:MAG: hypothetical protein H6729_13530 [Deltaproteobacteria bacterium]|nr:hypothetical protein [Deltaproteobacteria bacterium]
MRSVKSSNDWKYLVLVSVGLFASACGGVSTDADDLETDAITTRPGYIEEIDIEACSQPNPAVGECSADADCGVGERCVQKSSAEVELCIPSACGCQPGGWMCTADCSGTVGVCEPEPAPCVISGCSGEICADQAQFSVCVVLPPDELPPPGAVCERQASGACGWTAP